MSGHFETEFSKHHWERWKYQAGDFGSLKSAKPGIPYRYGVYIIRGPSELPRVRGSSNVVYIGQSGGGQRRGKQRIGPGNASRGRLFNTRGPDEIVREKIEQLFPGQQFSIECAFLDHEDPKTIEQTLL